MKSIVFKFSLLFLLLVSGPLRAEPGPAPARLGVDIYNSVGSYPRLIAFMKLGAARDDQRAFAFLNERLLRLPPPRALLAGSSIYFKELAEPLRIVDLKLNVFSYAGQRIDLRRPESFEQRLARIEKILTTRRSALFFWDWIFPPSYAMSTDSRDLAIQTGLLAVTGTASAAQCLSEASERTCTQGFLGVLAAVGAVGGLRENNPPTAVFCSPDFRGGQFFVLAGNSKPVLRIAEHGGDYEIQPTHLRAGTVASDHAARELLATCSSGASLNAVNIALAYPAKAATIASRANAPITARANLNRAPAARPEEQGGAAR